MICGGTSSSTTTTATASILSVSPPHVVSSSSCCISPSTSSSSSSRNNVVVDPMMIDRTAAESTIKHDEDNDAFHNDDEEYIKEDRKANELIISEMNALSIQDRERAYEDVHGATPDDNYGMPSETSDLLGTCYDEFDNTIQDLRRKFANNKTEKDAVDCSAYELACSIDETYVQDVKLRLMFLRSERYESTKAATRFVNWLTWKLYCFGSSKLCNRYIYIHDLLPETQHLIQQGWQQLLPQRDNKGRAVFFCSTWRNVASFPSNPMAIIQMFFYNMWCILQDDDTTQLSGIVGINYLLKKKDTTNQNPISMLDYKNHPMYEAFQKCPQMMNTMPFRLDSCHFNLDTKSILGPFITIMKLSTNAHHRARMRIHYGSATEIHYKLMGYGVPSTQLPLQNDGVTIKLTNHSKWLKRRKMKESYLLQQQQQQHQLRLAGKSISSIPSSFPGIELPSKYDVLLGRGQPINEHYGNRYLHDIIKQHRIEYDTAKGKGKKSDIAKRIVDMIQNGCRNNNNNKGRFLKRNDTNFGWWEQVPDSVALEKVCHGFRAKREDRNSSTSISSKATNNNNTKKNIQQQPSGGGTETSIIKASTTTSNGTKRAKQIVIHENAQNASQQQPQKRQEDQQSFFISTTANTAASATTLHQQVSTSSSTNGNINGYNVVVDRCHDTAVTMEVSGHDPVKFQQDEDTFEDYKHVDGFIDDPALLMKLPIVEGDAYNRPLPEAGEGGGTDLLFDLLVEQSHCFKCPPAVVMEWLHRMDIISLGDLLEACADEEFVERSMVAHGGLKKFKLGPFVKAVQAAVVSN